MCIKYFWVRIHIPFVLDKYLWNAGNNGRIPQLQSPKTWVAHYAMRNDNRFQVTRAAGSRAAGRVTAGHLMPSPESQPAPQYGSRPHGAVIFWQAAAGTLPGLRIRTLAPNSAEGHPTHPKATGQRAAGCGFHLSAQNVRWEQNPPADTALAASRPPTSRWNSYFFLKELLRLWRSDTALGILAVRL